MIQCDICKKDCSNNYGSGLNISPLEELEIKHLCPECSALYNKKEKEEHDRYNNVLINFVIELMEKKEII